MYPSNSIRCVFLGAVLLPISIGCGWVDSTGRQGNSSPDSEIQEDDGTAISILSLNEQQSIPINVVGTDPEGDALTWSWSDAPVSEGALSDCGTVDNFPSQAMEESFAAACADPESCSLDFEEISSGDNQSVFRISAPKMRASIGLVYNLISRDSEGGESVRPYTFCVASINEAPTAMDDEFAVLEGNQLVVTADQVNLLTNDEDDDDSGNQPLAVTRVITQPLAAAIFEIRPDGGFTYAFAGVNPLAEIQDSFVYEITDGTHLSSATAVIRILPQDDPPEQIATIPLLSVIAGIDFSEDLSTYFLDPENADLTFAADEDDLPPSGEITFSTTGVLGGSGEASDVGIHQVPIFVSDGTNGLDSSFTLEVLDNEPVETSPVRSQQAQIGQRFTLSMGQFFEDPEQQSLTFDLEVDSNRAALTINTRTGVVTGFFRAERTYELEVSADDGFNVPSVITVLVNVRDGS